MLNCCVSDDLAPQSAHQCPSHIKKFSHSISPEPAQGLHARKGFISERGETEFLEFSNTCNTVTSNTVTAMCYCISCVFLFFIAQSKSAGAGPVRDQVKSAGRVDQQIAAFTGTRRARCCCLSLEDKPRFF